LCDKKFAQRRCGYARGADFIGPFTA
jgi:hypothetical protein